MRLLCVTVEYTAFDKKKDRKYAKGSGMKLSLLKIQSFNRVLNSAYIARIITTTFVLNSFCNSIGEKSHIRSEINEQNYRYLQA